jgi:hypothetical protein
MGPSVLTSKLLAALRLLHLNIKLLHFLAKVNTLLKIDKSSLYSNV